MTFVMVCSFLNASLHLALGKYLAFLEGELMNHQSRVRLRLVVGSEELQPQRNAWLDSVAGPAKPPGSVRDVGL